MSWIVQTLLNNRSSIRETSDIESDEFNDLLIIEKAIETLRKEGKLTDEDLEVLGVSEPSAGSDVSSLERHALAKRKLLLCERIAYNLGGLFTDEGYLNEMAIKHKLNEKQLDTLRKYIKSKNKHKIIRKPIND